MAKVKASAVEKVKKQLPAVAGLGRGFEEADADAFAIPFLVVLQKNSPAADADAPEYVKGAKPGMFMNTATQELFTEAELIPCTYQRRFNRWAPRDLGGGFKGVFLPSALAGLEAGGTIKQSEEGRWYFTQPDGSINEKKCDTLTDTRLHFCLLVDEGKLRPVLVALSRTQLKKSKQWMTAMQEKGGDMFSHVYVVRTRDEENDKGKWKGWVISPDRATTEEEQGEALRLYESVAKGAVKVKMDEMRGAAHDE